MSPKFVNDFQAKAELLPLLVWTQRATGEIDWANQAWCRFTGLPPDAPLTDETWQAIIHPDDYEEVVAAFVRAASAGETYRIEHRVKPIFGDDRSYRWLLVQSIPQFDPSGTLVSWLGSGIDIHDTRAHLNERAELVAALSIAEARSFQTIADSVPQLMWSATADGWIDWYNRRWYAYTGQTPDDAIGWGWQDVHHPDDLPEVLRRWPASIASGQPFEMEFRLRRADGEFRMFLTLATPVRDASGAIVRWYGTNTDINQEYASRIRERRIAQTFQEAALQGALPEIPGLAFDAIYKPGKSEALVGGDWFDVFRLPDGRAVFSVGDVAGSGLHAAVRMGSLRQSIRTAALINPDSIAILDAVDRIVRDIDADLFATAFVGVFDPIHADLRYASAGHPPPMLCRTDGRIEPLPSDGLPLGLRKRSFAAARSATIEAGTTLVIYTDGLTEFKRDPLAGEDELIAFLARMGANEAPAHAIYDALVDREGAHDDIAILTVRFGEARTPRDGSHDIWEWSFEATDATAARAANHAIVAILAERGLLEAELTDAQLVFSELVGNALRYAPGRVHVALDGTTPSPVLHVLDEGRGFECNTRLPQDVLAETGRGLYIVTRLTSEMSITRRAGTGSHMRAVLTGTVRKRRT